jgi:hypothetical protein
MLKSRKSFDAFWAITCSMRLGQLSGLIMSVGSGLGRFFGDMV